MLKDIQIIENKELIKTCFIRAKYMELLAIEIGKSDKKFEYFMAGMFSAIDVLLNKDMKTILDELVLTDDVKEALLGGEIEIKMVLYMVINYELPKWNGFEKNKTDFGITREKLMSLYLKVLMWVKKLEY
jgi:EAL and modified HD-GYP domain-containing signal transduction protein